MDQQPGGQSNEKQSSWTGRERKKKKKINENRLRELSNTINQNNIHIIGIPERERGTKIYLNNWKLLKSGEENRNPDQGGTESPQQNQAKEVHTKAL